MRIDQDLGKGSQGLNAELKTLETIMRKASDDFLWVFPVVLSLLIRLLYCDRVSNLRRRLDDIHDEPEELYQKRIESIDIL